MNPELKAAFEQINARLAAIEIRLQTLEQSMVTQNRFDELERDVDYLTRLVSDTQAAALNAQH